MNTIAKVIGDVHQQASAKGDAITAGRWAVAIGMTGTVREAKEFFINRHPRERSLETVRKIGDRLVTRAPVQPGNTTDTTWAAPLAPLVPFGPGFVSGLRNYSVMERLKPFMRAMPMNVRLARITASTSVYWSAQGAPVQATSPALETLDFSGRPSICGLVAITKELAMASDPDAEAMISQDLSESVAQFSDEQFLTPTLSGVTDIQPASVTFGTTEVISSGTTLDAFTADLRNLLSQITTQGAGLHLLMRRSTALWICELQNADGSSAFPNMGALGGFIWGIPVLVSGNVPTDNNSPSNGIIVAIDASEIFYHEGEIEFHRSENAMLEMNTAPDSPRTASTVLVSCYQQNLIAILVRRYANWQRRRSGSVAWLSGLVA